MRTVLVRTFVFLMLFREESGEFCKIGKAVAMGFFSFDLIEFRKGCLNIGFHKKITDSASEGTEKIPAEERKTEPEDIKFFSVGHFF